MKTTERNAVCMDASAAWYINGIHKTVNRLIDTLVFDPFTGYNAEQKSAILQELRQIRNRSALLMTHKGNLCRLEKDAEEYQLISAPCGLDKQLYDDIWSKGIPTLITSGSLSDDGDFIRIKRSLGLDRLGIRLVDVRQERGVF
ncbi:MAG: hypothetical protein FWG31_02725 [Oscillospiraceae bacterium]|nr:hypothetical protein [Oscillospiraceae bacterium]